MIGSSFFAKSNPKTKTDKLIVNFDCVSDGKHFLFACRTDAMNSPYYHSLVSSVNSALSGKAEEVIFTSSAFYPSDQLMFKQGIGIAALNKSKFGLYLGKIHTSRDTVFQRENISALSDAAVSFAKALD